MSNSAYIPAYRVNVLYKNSTSREYVCTSVEFGSHPAYYEVMIPGTLPIQIPAGDILGIQYEKIHFL